MVVGISALPMVVCSVSNSRSLSGLAVGVCNSSRDLGSVVVLVVVVVVVVVGISALSMMV